jgi:hypothetical protein
MRLLKGEPVKTYFCFIALGLLGQSAHAQGAGQEVELNKPGEIVVASRGPKQRGGLPLFSEDGLMGTRDRNVIIGAATGYDKGEELLQYGNWYGPGWWGGGKDAAHAGDRKPVDSLDAAAMRHDFAYQLAEQQGRIHGLKEEQRLKAMADAIAVRETLQLDADPSKWPQPASDPEKANRYRDRIISGFDYTSGAREGTATVMNTTDWVTSPLINYEMDTSNQYDEEQLKRSVNILANNWDKNHPNATADDATVEQQEQRREAEQKRAVAEAKAQTKRDEEDRKYDPTGTKEFSLEKKMELPEDFAKPRARKHGPKPALADANEPSDEDKEAMKPGAAGDKPAETDTPPPDATIPVIPVDCSIRVVVWSPAYDKLQIPTTYKILDGNVTGSYAVTTADGKVEGKIVGTIKDNVMSLTNSMRVTSQGTFADGGKYSLFSTGKEEHSLVLNLDRTVTVIQPETVTMQYVVSGAWPPDTPRQGSSTSPNAKLVGKWEFVGGK